MWLLKIYIDIYFYPQIVFYAFAVVGMELFAHRFTYLGYDNLTAKPEQAYCNNTLLKGSTFANNRYCSNNFNDIINALVVLSALLVGNNWQDILLSYYDIFTCMMLHHGLSINNSIFKV